MSVLSYVCVIGFIDKLIQANKLACVQSKRMIAFIFRIVPSMERIIGKIVSFRNCNVHRVAHVLYSIVGGLLTVTFSVCFNCCDFYTICGRKWEFYCKCHYGCRAHFIRPIETVLRHDIHSDQYFP